MILLHCSSPLYLSLTFTADSRSCSFNRSGEEPEQLAKLDVACLTEPTYLHTWFYR